MADDDDLIRTQLRVTRIIAFALIMGLTVFLIMAGVIRSQQPPGGGATPIISYMSVAFFAAMAPLAFVIPAYVTRRGVAAIAKGTFAPKGHAPDSGIAILVPPTDTGKLLLLWQQAAIIARALLEGPGFFGLVAYLVEGAWPGLAVAIAAIFIMAAIFPMESRLHDWLRDKTAELVDLRSRGVS